MSRFFVLAGVLMMAGCAAPGGGQYVGLNQCAADGSVVMWEYPNSDGSYKGIAVSPENCR